MNIEEIREYCLSMPEATEDLPFDEVTLVFRIRRKIFAILPLDTPRWLVVRSSEDYARELREKYEEILPAYHMNKKYWSQIDLEGSLRYDFIKSLIRRSYKEIVSKLPKAVRIQLESLLTYDNQGERI